jgi:Rrf2 family protein
MRINKGVEWGVHACTLLAPLGPGKGLSLALLAEYHGVPAAYMAKQMQALSKAGIVRASRGKTGGYSLARPAAAISLWDIKAAIDGTLPAFRCTEIRQKGPCALSREQCRQACPIAAAFAGAETAYRAALKAISLSDIVAEVGTTSDQHHLAQIMGWYAQNISDLPE